MKKAEMESDRWMRKVDLKHVLAANGTHTDDHPNLHPVEDVHFAIALSFSLSQSTLHTRWRSCVLYTRSRFPDGSAGAATTQRNGSLT